MANILLITNYYFPKKSIASNRMEAFVKYLNELGHNLYVVTDGDNDKVVNTTQATIYYVKNDNFITSKDTNVKENKVLHYAKCIYNKIFESFITNINIKKFGEIAKEIVEKDEIDVIISSYPEIETSIVAHNLKKKFKRVKWIADMRDALWTIYLDAPQREKMIQRGKDVLNCADVILAISKPILDGYRHIINNDDIKYYELRNGFDFDYSSFKMNNHNYFNIVYAGSFYGLRKPDNFFSALKLSDFKNNIRVTIIGNYAPINIPSSLEDIIVQVDSLGYMEVINYLKSESDLLLLITPEGSEKGTFTGKIFDYIGCGKPVLALVPLDDVAADLLSRGNFGYMVSNDDIVGIKECIDIAYKDFINKKRHYFDEALAKEHHRKVQVAKLDRIIREIL